jgi:hypothetical protein
MAFLGMGVHPVEANQLLGRRKRVLRETAHPLHDSISHTPPSEKHLMPIVFYLAMKNP